VKIIPEPIRFEWDKGNRDKSLKKHEVANKESEQTFENKPRFIFEDPKHSLREQRYGLFGQTDKGRLLSIVFTIREEKIRIITARDISRKERSSYEKIKANTKI